MSRKKTTVYIEEDLLRSAKVAAARSGWKEYEVFEEALKSYLGLHVLERVWTREELPNAEEAQEIAYTELRASRGTASESDTVV
jgi:hypothetical protein